MQRLRRTWRRGREAGSSSGHMVAAMIWTAEPTMEQGALIATAYPRAGCLPARRKAALLGRLRGADKTSTLAQAGIDQAQHLVISVDDILEQMAARGWRTARDGRRPVRSTTARRSRRLCDIRRYS